MRNIGVIVVVGSLMLSGMMMIAWLIGLVTGFTAGGLIHLLLITAILSAPVGVVAGVLLIVLGKRQT